MSRDLLNITPESVWLQRRKWLQWAGAASASGLVMGPGALAQTLTPQVQPIVAMPFVPSALAGAQASDKVTPWKDATTYNNFYEFGTSKEDPYEKAHG